MRGENPAEYEPDGRSDLAGSDILPDPTQLVENEDCTMTGMRQNRYRAKAETWVHVRQKLAAKDWLIVEKNTTEPNSGFFEISNRSSSGQALWIDISPIKPSVGESGIFVDMHWMDRARGPDPDWMLHVAAEVEQYLMEAGAQSVFGEVRSDRTLRKRLGVNE
jgi:hypothetical protein